MSAITPVTKKITITNRLTKQSTRMAASSSRTCFTREEVMTLLDEEEEDVGMEDPFFPRSDEELGAGDNDSGTEENTEDEEKYSTYQRSTCTYQNVHHLSLTVNRTLPEASMKQCLPAPLHT